MRLLTILLALFIASLAPAEVHWSRNLLLPQYRSLTSAANENLHFPDLPPPAGTGILIGNQDAGKIDLLLITAPGKNPRDLGVLLEQALAEQGIEATVAYTEEEGIHGAATTLAFHKFGHSTVSSEIDAGALRRQIRKSIPTLRVAWLASRAGKSEGIPGGYVVRGKRDVYDLTDRNVGVIRHTTEVRITAAQSLILIAALSPFPIFAIAIYARRRVRASGRPRSELKGWLETVGVFGAGPFLILGVTCGLIALYNDTDAEIAQAWFGWDAKTVTFLPFLLALSGVAGLLIILWQGYDPTPESDPPIPKLSKGRRVVLLLGASLAMVCLALGFILPDRIPWARPLSSFAILIANLPLLLVHAFSEKSKPADPEDHRSPTVT